MKNASKLILLFVVVQFAHAQKYPGLFDSGPVEEPNEAPVWTATPMPEFVVDTAGAYDLPVSDPNADPLTIANEAGCTLPGGITIDSPNIQIDYDGTGTEGTTTGCVFSADDGIAAPVNSDAFDIVISATGAFAPMSPPAGTVLEGWACPGCDWAALFDTAPTIVVHRVTNLNTSGAGSLDEALGACTDANWDIVVFETSGLVEYSANSVDSVECDNLTVEFATAPSPGFFLRDLMVRVGNATRQHWSHVGLFKGSATNQGQGDCVQIGASVGPVDDIVFSNFGCLFGEDENFGSWVDTGDFSFLQGMSSNPFASVCCGGSFHSLWGSGAETGTTLMARVVMSHSANRSPRPSGVQNTNAANNVIFNCGQQCTEVANGDADGIGYDLNWKYNVYVDGPDQSASLLPIIIRNNIEPGTQMYLEGNRVFGINVDDSDQSNLINNDAGANFNEVGTEISSAWPTDFVATTIGGGDANLEEFALLVCDHAGPRPTDANRPNHFDRMCDEIQNKFDGTGDQGGIISDPANHPDGAAPTLAVNTCDLDIADDCGTGKPAIPSETDSVATWRAWLNDVRCSVMPAGATGC